MSATKRVSRNPSETIVRISNGELERQELPLALRIVRDAFAREGVEIRPRLLALLLHVARFGDLISDERGIRALGAAPDNNFASAVCALGRQAGSWARPIEIWRPRSHNRRRQFAELCRHLLAKYDVPPFMDSVFFEGFEEEALRHQCWFAHVGAGKNIRQADVPIAMTAKMAHQFLRAPPDSTVLEAIRFGQVLGVGGDARLAQAVLQTRLKDEFANDDFWLSVLVFLAANPMLDAMWIGPMIDYLHATKFGPAATEPNLAMKGRTVPALLRRVQEWHEALSREKKARKAQWAPSGLPALEWKTAEAGDPQRKHWRMVELLNSRELADEGNAMHHCVGTYDYSCASGRVSIWSLRCEDAKGNWRILTVEVENRTRRIVQARGIYNRFAAEEALRILRDWAARARLDVASYL